MKWREMEERMCVMVLGAHSKVKPRSGQVSAEVRGVIPEDVTLSEDYC